MAGTVNLEKVGQQLNIMLWKVLLVRRMHLFGLFAELIVPLITSIILIAAIGPFAADETKSTKPPIVPAQTFPDPIITLDRAHFLSVLILYAPINNHSTQIMNILDQNLGPEQGVYLKKIVSFPDEEALYNSYLQGVDDSTYGQTFGIIFEGDDDSSFNYTIRSLILKGSVAPFPGKDSPGPVKILPYDYFSDLEAQINLAYLQTKFPSLDKDKLFGNLIVKWYRFPYPSYPNEENLSLSQFVPWVLVFGFIITFTVVIKRLAAEQSNQIREMYRITGLIDWIYWFTHFVDHYSVFLVQVIIITLLYTLGINGNGQALVFNYTSPSLIFTVLVLWGFNFMMLALTLSIPFNRPINALVFGVVFWIIQIVPAYYVDPVTNDSIDVIQTDELRVFSCLMPNMALTLAIRTINEKEMYGYGATWNNLFETTTRYGSLSLGIIIIILVLTSLLYIPLIYYLMNVIPTQYGITRHWLFPLHSLFGYKPKQRKHDEESSQGSQQYFEPLESSDEVKLSVKNITKDYGAHSQRTLVVNNVSLNIPHNQITMLLGENGAGKTTLLSMIMGMIPPTEGSVIVNGCDIVEETSQARCFLSFCPQHNILQPELTVEQHLRLYGALRGVPKSQLKSAVDKIAEDTKLAEFKHVRPVQLSGGMCRKLHLGIALIGDTEIVVVDEPTSGLDPESRRAVWDILNEIKAKKTVVMTTHFIEEADAVGDKIAILRKGNLACFGSPMFLKKIFGTGYELRIAKNEESNVEHITNLIFNHFPEAKLSSNLPDEVVFTLSQEFSNNKIFFKFFRELEIQKDSLKISSWGLTYTTLEEVFIKVVESQDSLATRRDLQPNGLLGKQANGINGIQSTPPEGSTIIQPDHPTITGFKLLSLRLKALILKRFHYSKRYWRTILFQILIPVVMFAILMRLDKTAATMDPASMAEIEISLHHLYGQSKTVFSNHKGNIPSSEFGQTFQSVMAEEEAEIEFLNSSTTLDEFMLKKTTQASFNQYVHDYIVGMEWGEEEIKVYINGEALYGLPISVNLFFETLYRKLSGSSTFKINVHSHQLPLESPNLHPFTTLNNRVNLWRLLLQLTMPFLAASYGLIPIHERNSRAKLLQIMTGLSPILYWLGHFIFDLAFHTICTFFIYLTVIILDSQAIFYQSHIHLAFILSLLVLGITSIPFAYLFSFLFHQPSAGYSFLVILFLIFGLITAIASVIIDFLAQLMPAMIKTKNTFDCIVGLSPLQAMTQEILKTLTISVEASSCKKIPQDFLNRSCQPELIDFTSSLYRCCPQICTKNNNCYVDEDPLSWQDGIFPTIVQLLCQACFFFALLFLLEHFRKRLEFLADWSKTIWCRIRRKGQHNGGDSGDQIEEDSDVTAERYRVKEQHSMNRNENPDVLTVIDLKKNYGTNRAVKGLTFGVGQNECFGLLGVNGAGKSTTFKMLVGDILPSGGNAYIDNFDLSTTRSRYQQYIGYCPQYDALIDRLTAREMLFLFGRLRGMDEKRLSQVVDQLIENIDLKQHADKITGFYSGGNKRKLSLALALIGNPRVIFLDEPSSGVDAGNRRRMWSVLSSYRDQGSSLVLTSHSMEECETLCSRIAIMVKGKFQCLGSLQHLRYKFGQGYSLYVKIKKTKVDDENYLRGLKDSIEEKLGAELKQHHLVNLFYHIKNKTLKWSTLFETMEEIKASHQLEDYVISGTSLDQIFLQFAQNELSTD